MKKKAKNIEKDDSDEDELSEEELEKYSNEFWAPGSFIQSINSSKIKEMKKTINKNHNEDMNFNCKKCNKKISAHNKDWHDKMCDDCFNKTYFPEELNI